jgi:S-adenosylmethionine decarboxylase
VDFARGPARFIVYSDAMQGLHLTADLYQCRCQDAWLTNAQQLCEWCVQAAQAAGLQPIDQLFHALPASGCGPAGVTAAVLLAQSHVCLHTWPEQRAVTLDVYVGDFDGDHSAQARGLMTALIERFQPEWTEQRSMDRGDGE